MWDTESHRKAQELAVRAGSAARRGNVSSAKELYYEAARLEREAYSTIPENKPRTRGIIAVSLVSMLYKAFAYTDANEAIESLQKDSLIPHAYSQLQDLKRHIDEESRMINELVSYRSFLGNATLALQALLNDDLPSLFNTLSRNLDIFYSFFEKFCGYFSDVDEYAPVGYLDNINNTITFALQSEKKIWKLVQDIDIISDARHVSKKESERYEKELLAVLQGFASRRARPVVVLKRYQKQLTGKITGSGQEVGDVDDFQHSIRRLKEADELDQEMELTNILLNHEEELIEYLKDTSEIDKRNKLVDIFWQLADLIIQNCVYKWNRQRRVNDWTLILLLSSSVRDHRFSTVHMFLETNKMPDVGIFNKCFDGESDSIQIGWRCILVGHPKEEIRKLAAAQLVFDSTNPYSLGPIGPMIARNRVPVDVLLHVGQVVSREHEEEKKKLFFDCIRRRLIEEVKHTESKRSMVTISVLVGVLMEFDFLSETLYFNRFRHLFDHYLNAIGRLAPDDADFAQKLFCEIEKRHLSDPRKDSGLPRHEAKEPAPVKLRLAQEEPYWKVFIINPNYKIAGEAMKHIKRENAGWVYRFATVREDILQDIVSKHGLPTSNQNRMDILMHPKCPLDPRKVVKEWFKEKTELSKRNLTKLARGARRSDVRTEARLQLKNLWPGERNF